MVIVNGETTDKIAALDRGLQYGDGLFETLPVRHGRPCLWTRHIQRLTAGCERLRLPPPDADLLFTEAKRLIGDTPEGVLKIILTRGSGGRGYRPPEAVQPTRILSLHPWPDYPEHWWREGVRVRFCETRLGLNPGLAGLKHLNRLEQVIARAEWHDPGIAEGLMRDSAGDVVEGTSSNLFLMMKGGLVTPEIRTSGVQGVMRTVVLEAAEELGIPTWQRALTVEALDGADALFLTNCLIGIWPVRELNGERREMEAIPRALFDLVMKRRFDA